MSGTESIVNKIHLNDNKMKRENWGGENILNQVMTHAELIS